MRARVYSSPWLSKIAYLEKDEIDKKLKERSFSLVHFFDHKALQGYIAECQEGQVIVFRGSQNVFQHPEDWVANLKTKIIDTKVGRCQEGYYELVEAVEDEIIEYLRGDDFLVTGHSAGAGCSRIFKKMLELTGRRARVVPFASPNITDDKNFDPDSFYVINNADGVTRFPFKIMGHCRSGKMIFFNWRGNYIKNSKFLERLVQFFLDIDDLAKDHDIKDYEKLWYKNFKKIWRVIALYYI